MVREELKAAPAASARRDDAERLYGQPAAKVAAGRLAGDLLVGDDGFRLGGRELAAQQLACECDDGSALGQADAERLRSPRRSDRDSRGGEVPPRRDSPGQILKTRP